MAIEIMKAPEQFKCKTCRERYCDAERRLPGSLGRAPIPLWVVADPAGGDIPLIESDTCLLPMVDESTWYLFRLHKLFEKGVLYQTGGLMDQPNRYIEAMFAIGEAINNA